eukprot:TRINITY_DN20653_c0_g1_i1.p2 TRINITY_DN20653_c0_g1~~TRINITY_DN20653_c0_g1_i1.p2  ORF type:complete len:501 (-),score=109.11 TRINITY_DN20653_c0_g1_i1:34-1536(-)
MAPALLLLPLLALLPAGVSAPPPAAVLTTTSRSPPTSQPRGDLELIDWEDAPLGSHGGHPLGASNELENFVQGLSSSVAFRELPPVPKNGGPLDVGVRVRLVKFQSLDEAKNTANIVIDLLLAWADDRLAFSKKNQSFGGIWARAGGKLPVSSSLVWTPDVVILNQVEHMDAQFAPDDSPLAIADEAFRRRTGANVLWRRRVNVKSRCDVDMSSYPFDEQHCKLVIGPWGSSRRQLVLVAQDAHQRIGADSLIHSPQFQTSSLRVQSRDEFTRNAAENFSEVEYAFSVKRYGRFYLVHYVMPMAAVTLLTVGTMWMSAFATRANSGTRLVLCVVQVMNITAEWRPANQGDIWLDQFHSHCLAISMASVLQSLVMDYLESSWIKQNPLLAGFGQVVETASRSCICLVAITNFFFDFCRLLRQDDASGVYESFHGSSRLLAGVVYILMILLGTSSVVGAAWILLPRQVFQEYFFCQGCSRFAVGATGPSARHYETEEERCSP